jgi:hypothetical protein
MITVYNDCNGKIMVNKVILRTSARTEVGS